MSQDKRKTKAEPIAEVEMLRKRLAEIEATGSSGVLSEDANAEHCLHALTSRYEALLSAVPEIIMEVDCNKVYTWANAMGLDFFGDDVVGHEAQDYFLGEQDTYNAVRPLFNGNEDVIYLESWQRRKDGEERLLAWWCRTLKDSDGNVTGALSTARDITEEKFIETALRESGERYRSFVENFEGIAFRANMDFIPLFFHGEVESITGYKESDFLIGKPKWNEIIHPEDFVALKESWENVRTVPHFSTAREYRIICKDGSIRWIHERNQNICNDSGTPMIVQGTIYDITERKQAEEERHKIEMQMQQAQKLESLGVLAGGIAHDFNNILMAILGNADIALEDLPEASPVHETIEEIVKAARHAAELCRQMLAYSGKGRFEMKQLDLSGLVEEMTHMLRVSISNNAVLNLNLANDLPPIEADPAQIRQIVMNLITNASEAMVDRSGFVSLSTSVMHCNRADLSGGVGRRDDIGPDKELPEGPYVCLEVADTGVGMDPEIVAKIFDPFFTTKFTGRGLGLAAVLGVVYGHKGLIKINSEPGKGTQFKVFFPVLDKSVAPVDPTQFPDEAWHGNNAAILLVDDKEPVREVGQLMLKRIGFEVLTASDGFEAIEVFRRHSEQIVCVVLDMTMPHMDGEECFHKLREIKDDISVLITSGYSEQDITKRFAGQKDIAFIQKPYELSLLRRKLRKLIEQ